MAVCHHLAPQRAQPVGARVPRGTRARLPPHPSASINAVGTRGNPFWSECTPTGVFLLFFFGVFCGALTPLGSVAGLGRAGRLGAVLTAERARRRRAEAARGRPPPRLSGARRDRPAAYRGEPRALPGSPGPDGSGNSARAAEPAAGLGARGGTRRRPRRARRNPPPASARAAEPAAGLAARGGTRRRPQRARRNPPPPRRAAPGAGAAATGAAPAGVAPGAVPASLRRVRSTTRTPSRSQSCSVATARPA